jgi:VIT1/CCC1 family predicted Fe2+/Mn2+ transporter
MPRENANPIDDVHYINRIGWLRAAVLGANDGLLSTSSLIVGVAAAAASPKQIVLIGVAGLVAGAMSMAAGEFVSVSSQADAETADLKRECAELKADRPREERELAAIYVTRGLDKALALRVAQQLTAEDALGAHARDELGISEAQTAKPIQAALASAGSFSLGAAAPLLTAIVVPAALLAPAVFAVSILALAILGAAGASAGGSPLSRAIGRAVFWGGFAMGVTAGVGRVFNVSVG